MSAFDTQVGGTHYKHKRVQPIQLAYAVFGGDTCCCKIAKYLTREKDGWEEQTEKANHIFLLLKEIPVTDLNFTHELSTSQEIVLKTFIEQEPLEIQQALLAVFALIFSLVNPATIKYKDRLSISTHTTKILEKRKELEECQSNTPN